MTIEDWDMMGAREAMVMAQQPRGAEISTSSLSPWEQREDEKRVFTDFLDDAKRRCEQVTRDQQARHERELRRRQGYDGVGPRDDGVGPSDGAGPSDGGAGSSDGGVGPSDVY
jgi:hypothetical protein